MLEAGKKFTVRAARQLQEKGLKALRMSDDDLVGMYLAEDLVNPKTGEIYAEAGEEITEKSLKGLNEHGYKELTLPAGRDGSHRIERNALHIWPRGGFMLIALPNIDGSFTVTLFLALKGGVESFAALDSRAAVDAFFTSHFPDVVPRMPRRAFQSSVSDDRRAFLMRPQPTRTSCTVELFQTFVH